MSKLLLSSGAIAGIVVGGVALVMFVIMLIIVPLKPYFSALFSGARINPFKLAAMKMRKLDLNTLIEAYILAKKSKVGIKINELEAHYLAGGNVKDVVSAMAKAKQASLPLSFSEAKSIDLTTHNVLSVVDSVITPKVIEIPSIKGVTRDNFELEVKANISVKAKIDSLVGNFGKDTLESKVSKYIVAKIVSLNNHKNATPYNLTEDILKSGLDIKSGYQLLSVDIVNINVTRDVGAELAGNDLERMKVQAQIEAERIKNNAFIEEQQSKIRMQEMKNDVLEAEAEVPRAIAEAIRDGRFSVMDYYKLMNLQADTAMRRSMIGGGDGDEEPKE